MFMLKSSVISVVFTWTWSTSDDRQQIYYLEEQELRWILTFFISS